jgi:soluble lytic murein transglycosylase-like protein
MRTKSTIFSILFLLLSVVAIADEPIETELAPTIALTEVVSPFAEMLSLFSVEIQTEVVYEVKAQPIEFFVEPQAPAADPRIVGTITEFNQELSEEDTEELAVLIEETAARHEVDPLLVTALISQESAFRADATSPVGAIGLGQLMPYTAAELGVDPTVPAENLDGAVRYLAQNMDYWAHADDPVTLALASYNAGPGAVESFGGVPPYAETQHYVEVITSHYAALTTATVADTVDIYG